MSFDADTLYGLLPAIHRSRDIEAAQRAGTTSGPLRQLLGVIAEQFGAIEENLDQLYDDQFIETCADWVVPYIGALVGYVPIREGGVSVVSRAEVADTIRWRRAKGTARSIEGIARDVTGRDVVVVEFFRRMATTQHLNHIRPAIGTASLRLAAPALRQPIPFADPGGPFDTVPRNADLRAVSAGGRWAIANVVCFLWTWRAWLRNDADPVALDATRFLIHPLGIDGALVNAPDATRPGAADAVATRLRLRGDTDPGSAIARSVAVTIDGQVQAFAVCDLSDTGPDPATSAWAHMPTAGIRLDPERGRLAFATAPVGHVRVSSWFPSVGLLGGGAYPRSAGFDAGLSPLLNVGPNEAFATLADALAAPAFSGHGIIELAGNTRHAAAGLPATIAVAAGGALEIRAADGSWPVLALGQPLVLAGGPGSALVLDGLVIEGAGLQIPASSGGTPNGLQRVTLRHCTLVPGLGLTRAGAPVTSGAPSLACAATDTVVVLEACVTGPLRADAGGQLRISDSIVDAGSPAAPAVAGGTDPAAPAAALFVYNSTLRGAVSASVLALASNTIFLGPVAVQQRQTGLVRFSAVGPGFVGPRQYSCIGAAVTPLFQSWQVGTADYGRLSSSTDPSLLTGADDGGAVGAYHGALDTPVEDGLRVRLGEFTPFGRDSGVLHARRA